MTIFASALCDLSITRSFLLEFPHPMLLEAPSIPRRQETSMTKRTPRRSHERRTLPPAHPTKPTVVDAVTACFGPDVAQLMNWAIRATCDDILRRERKALSDFKASIVREFSDPYTQKWKKAGLTGQLAACDSLTHVLGHVQAAEVVERVVMRFEQVARRTPADVSRMDFK